MRRTTWSVIVGVVAVIVSQQGCSSTIDTLGLLDRSDDAGASFQNDEAGVSPSDQLAQYCPTLTCPASHVTCPGDRFPCAGDLLRDDSNCGRCGNVCPGAGDPAIGELSTKWACVDGQCTMQCSSLMGDCNGIVDDGCEVSLQNDPLNCGTCGNKCIATCTYGACDCAYLGPQATLCGTDCSPDLQQDDTHCGSCDVACDTSEQLRPSWNASVGCVQGTCNRRKCLPDYRDCNDDLEKDSGNGCETFILGNDRANCGGCGVTCSDNQICIGDSCFGCQAGETLCDPEITGAFGCFVLASDPFNCGGCGYTCPTSAQGTHGTATCIGGLCGFTCDSGYANCDASADNGCEVNVRLDPEHCGTCDRHCPLAGQACVEGQCVEAPCTSEPTR